MSIYLASYKPLVASKTGREASIALKLPPFIDGSIRREPDLEHEFPAITCLCRKGKFTPRLNDGDVVGYMTVKQRFGTEKPQHRRLTAVLRVIARLESHEEAATWYRSRGIPLPSNCMVDGNPPRSLSESHQIHKAARTKAGDILQLIWDTEYEDRARDFGTVLISRIMFRDLSWDSPIVEDDQLESAFGEIPGTQNPGKLCAANFEKLMTLLGIPVLPSVP